MKLINYIFCLVFILVFTTCKKKTNIKLRVFNYAMNEPITDAKVILIESETSGSLFSAHTTCKTIAESTVDADGYCYFDNERLKKNGQYACKVSYAYGKPQTNNCTVTQTSKITAGQNNDRILHLPRTAGFCV